MARIPVVVTLAVALAVTGMAAAPPAQAQPAPSGVVLDLRAPEGAQAGEPVTTLDQRGSAEVEVALARLDGGAAVWEEAFGHGLVVDLPSATPDEAVPRAVLAVRDVATSDPARRDALEPGAGTFSFGADFRVSLVRMGRYDDGDNIIQRGLASDESQYKVEIAGGRIACVIKGSQGSVRVHVGPQVDPRSWYTVRCTRLGSAVRLWVVEHRQDGSALVTAATRHGQTGDISWGSKSPPLSIGGKLAANGVVISSATDQLNGGVGRPVLVVESSFAPTCAAATCPYAVPV